MRLMVFNVVAMLLALTAYALGLGGTVACLIYLFILFNGILDRWARPMIDRLKPYTPPGHETPIP